MKKITLLVVIAFVSVSFSKGQYIKILRAGGNHIMNDSIVVCTGKSTNEMVATLYVINADTGIVRLSARRNPEHLVGGTSNSFCWAGNCYPTTVNISTSTQFLNPADTASTRFLDPFKGDYYPNGNLGNSLIKYTFYDTTRTWDSASVYVLYKSTATTIAQLADSQTTFSAPYPNPANSTVNFNYSLASGVSTASMKIFNLLGECIQTLPLNTNKTKTALNVQSIPSGIYVCEIETNGCKPAYQKMIVSH